MAPPKLMLAVCCFLSLWMGQLCRRVVLEHDCCSEDEEWWKTTVIYQIDPRSFKDSNADGYGDIPGIIEKLDHLVDLGMETLLIQPMYPSSDVNYGHDVTDHESIDKLFGSQEDFEKLVKEIHDKDLKIVLDFIPNHTSDKHPWFENSVNKVPGFEDMYVWADGKYDATSKTRTAPNNWLSKLGGSAWTFNEKRGQFYYHLLGPNQPDLNYRSADVLKNVERILRLWLDRGVDGFRVSGLRYLFESTQLTDETYLAGRPVTSLAYSDLAHAFTADLPESYPVLIKWRAIADEYKKDTNNPRVIIVEPDTTDGHVMNYYKYDNVSGAHYPLNLQLLDLDRNSCAKCINKHVSTWMSNMPRGETANWMIGNHDLPRVVTRLGSELSDGLAMLNMLLPGAALVYYGEEIGMEDTILKLDDMRDAVKRVRDPHRAPMQWNSGPLAGFSTAPKAWLPLNPNYWHLSVTAQKEAPWSRYKLYQRLTSIRREHSITHGALATYVFNDGNVFAFTRSFKDYDTYIVVINLGTEEEEVDLTSQVKDLDGTVYVTVPSVNSAYNIGQKVATKLLLRPKASVTLVLTADGTPPPSSSAAANALNVVCLMTGVLILAVSSRVYCL